MIHTDLPKQILSVLKVKNFSEMNTNTCYVTKRGSEHAMSFEEHWILTFYSLKVKNSLFSTSQSSIKNPLYLVDVQEGD